MLLLIINVLVSRLLMIMQQLGKRKVKQSENEVQLLQLEIECLKITSREDGGREENRQSSCIISFVSSSSP